MPVFILHPAGGVTMVEATTEARARLAAAITVLGPTRAEHRPELWQRRALDGGGVYDPMGEVRRATPAEVKAWLKATRKKAVPLAADVIPRDPTKTNPARRKSSKSYRR